MRRSVVLFTIMLSLAVSRPAAAVQAAAGSRAIALEMLVVIPRQHHWAIFEQVVLAGSHPGNHAIGILGNARHLVVIGARRSAREGNMVKLTTVSRRVGLQYSVARQGQWQTLAMTSPEAVQTFVVLVPPTVRFSQSENPIMARIGEQRIPGVPKSPVFNEYGTHHLQKGQVLPLVLGQVPSALSGIHSHRRIGQLFLMLAALISIATLGSVCFGHRASRPLDAFSGEWNELAALVARWSQGEIGEGQYLVSRDILLGRLRSQGEILDG
jgi:hypothetical protein